MLTFDFVFNIFLIAGSVVWLVLLPFSISRIIKKRSKRTFLGVACNSVSALSWLVSVWLPFRRHGTLNTAHNDTLFYLGIVVTFLPDLIAWWQTRFARVS